VRGKYCWLVADKPNEQSISTLTYVIDKGTCETVIDQFYSTSKTWLLLSIYQASFDFYLIVVSNQPLSGMLRYPIGK
jgi:hypothetical protein